VPFIAAYFNEPVSSSTLTPPSRHSARRVYPELQNLLFQKAKENPLPEGEGSLRTIIPHTQGEGTFWEDGFCDFTFGSAQNDRGERHTAKSESLRAGETKHKGVWCYAHWMLMQGTLVLTQCALVVDVLYTGC